MQINKPDGLSGIGPYQQRDQENNKDSEKKLPTPQNITKKTELNSPKKETHIPDEYNQTQVKTNGYASTLLNFASHALIYGANSLSKQMVTGGIKLLEVAFFSFKDIKDLRQQNLEELKKLTGHEHLGLFLEQLSIPLSKIIISSIQTDLLKVGMENEVQFIRDVTKCMTTKMAVNIARHLKSEGKEVNLLSISACITTQLKAQLKSIQQELKDAETITDHVAKEAAIKKATDEAVESFLKLSFPKGENELPLRDTIKNFAWFYLKDSLLPSILREMASLGNGVELISQIATENPKSQKMTSVNEVTQEVEALVIKTGPKLLADKEVADAATKIVLTQLGMARNKQTEVFATWVSEQIKLFGKTENSSISDLWNFLGKTTGASVFFLLSNLTKNGDIMQDWKEGVISNLLITINTFENQHHAEIEKVYKEQLQKGIKPEGIKKTPEYLQCFVPLSKMIEEITGIEEFEAILSPKTYGSLEKAINKNLTEILASSYQDYLEPLAVIYQATKNPQVLRSPIQKETVTQQKINETVEVIAEQLSKYLNKNSEKIKEKICDKVWEALPSIEDVRNLVKNEKNGTVISEITSPLIEKESTFNTWLRKQIKNLLLKMGSTNKEFLWNLFTESVAGILEHIVIYKKTHAPNDNIENILELIVNQFTGSLSNFQKIHRTAIQKQFYELKDKGIKPQENKEFRNSFIPLCENFLNNFGIKREGGGVLERSISKLVLKYLPGKLAEYYQESLVIQESIEKAEIKLKTILKDESNQKNEIIIKQIENICHVISEKMTEVISENLYNSMIEQIVSEKMNKTVDSNQKISIHRFKATFTKEAKELVRPEIIKAQIPLIKQQVYSLLIQSLSNYLEQLALKNINTMSPEKIFEEIGKTLDSRLKADAAVIKKASLVQNPEKRKIALREAFLPLTEELISLVVPSAHKNELIIPLEIPFANLIEESWQEYQSQIIPDLFGKMYTSSTTWTSEIEKSKEVLRAQTKKDYAAEACRVMAEWTQSFIPAFMIRIERDLTNGIYDAAAKYLEQTGNKEGLSVQEFIEQNEEEIKKRFAESCFDFFAPDGQVVSATKLVTKEFIEGAYLKIFSNLTVKINDAQGRVSKEQKDFMVTLGISLLDTANKHFGAIITSMNKEKKSAAFEVSHETFIKDFEEKRVLNPGIPQDMEIYTLIKELSKKLESERRTMMKLSDPVKREKCLERIIHLKRQLKEAKAIQSKERQKFFAPFAKNCMDLSGIKSPEDIPCPLPHDSPLRQKLFIKFQEELLPMVLEEIFEVAMDPNTRVKMALAGLKSVNDALDQMPTLKEELLAKDDPMQRELNKVCGELVLQLVQLVPKSMIKAAFKIERVQELTAEMVGKSVRNYLGNELDIMKLLNQGIKDGMDSLHPGEWVLGEEGQITFVARNESERGEFNFSFPLNDRDEEVNIQKKMLIADKERKELRKAMVDTTHRVMSESFKSFLIAPLIKLKKIWDKCIDFVFGKYGPHIRNAFDQTGFKFIYRLLETFSFIFSFPFKKLFWFFAEIHIGWKADEVIKSMQLDIHENLFYQLVNTFMDALNQKTPIIQSEDIIKSANLRDEEEHLEVIQFLKRFGLMLEDIRY
jgi:hypothetical protein